jgi:AmmeMemoRadiSam system protein A
MAEKHNRSDEHPLAKLARESIESFIRGDKVVAPPASLTPEMEQAAGVFVCLKIGGELRGCIGTFEPTTANVAEEIIHNAISAAVRDPRFPPVAQAELDKLDVSVDVLTPPEPIEGLDQLDPRRYGVIVSRGYRRGLLLPDLEGVDTARQQVDIARRKAGIGPTELVQLHRFEVKRYK